MSMMDVKRALCLFMGWLDNNLPTFDDDTDRHLRRERIMECTKLCFFLTSGLILVALPLWNTLSLTSGFFRVTHFFKHTVFKNHSRIHSWRIWHNTSLQQLVFWSVFVGICTFAGAGRDLIQITKRMGRLSVALMPPLLFLTLRPSPLPETLYLSLVPIHRWMSRVVVVESLLHTILYLWFMYLKGSLIKVFKPANFSGVIAMVLFVLIGVTSVSKMRRWNFQVFYYVHYLSTWATVILLHYHARPSIPSYTFLNVAILVWQIIYRISHTKITTITAVPISPSLTLVEFPKDDLSSKPILPSGHVRLSQQHSSWLKWLFHQLAPLQHPYTIASLPTDDTVKLIVRNSNFPLISNTAYRVTGAFEPKLNFMSKVKLGQILRTTSSSGNLNSASLLHSPLSYNIHARRALICVGGSAISFALPLLRILNFNGVTVKLIWVSKDYRDLKVLNHFKHNFEGMEIYVSGASGSEQDIQIDYVDSYPDSDDASVASSLGEEGQGYNERTPLTWGTPNHNTLSTKSHLSLVDGTNKTKNYGSTANTGSSNNISNKTAMGEIDPNDEIDFTEIFSLGNAKSILSNRAQVQRLNANSPTPAPISDHELFRKPSLIEAPTGLEGNEVDEESRLISDNDKVLRIPSGIKVFFGRPSLGEKDYLWCMERECAYDERADDGCEIYNGGNTHTHDLSDIVVMAAGPVGLVESTRRFATDYGLNFHAECYTV
ncbi:ZYRO0F01518p [Zygosaccharomyces rouxii]|uniref:ZYRO0F01518p n=1 Tax=Zygosaccharomyces rouxii (strain ATCC 2623 / CBS 732 / NBRC 1130 / NCYC 568 / NRRL Y-229) TaxID=559307 RepID=C5DX18_ZYGRC|nr:uncharacterized protein ZYRO0F01518g [Zygosaccharomyces rouxii]KAH9199094.1 ferric reductase like transmembrane component-domain-containing protein [Zygosaccharomyces rouxii]CAR28329.1 ZYRO0F01518p [Zygosaccharomyces rouxii]